MFPTKISIRLTTLLFSTLSYLCLSQAGVYISDEDPLNHEILNLFENILHDRLSDCTPILVSEGTSNPENDIQYLKILQIAPCISVI